MHLAFVIDTLGAGGSQRQLVELAARLQQSPGVRCSVVAYRPGDFFEARLGEEGVSRVEISRGGRLDPRFPWKLARWLRVARPDVVHAFLLYPSFWSLLAIRMLPRGRQPVLVAGERSSLIAWTRVAGRVQRLVYRASDAVTVNARPMIGAIEEQLGVPRERLHHLPNGIDLERWDRDAAEPCPLELEPSCLHLALIGGFRGREKGHLVLFDALSRLGRDRIRDWRIWCLGARAYGVEAARQIERAVTERGLEGVVRLEEPVRNVASLMRHLDAVVLPSLFEGFPNVVLEAMASSLPVVATPVGEVPHLVEDGGNGLIVAVGDADALAAALERLEALGPEARRRMGARGRALAEARYEMGAVAQAHLDLYRELGRRRGRR